ncbi:MAG TPA: arsinothricin resistance N-acetyltransferase ArsN1 family B [Stellaceae bacterium]|nr:arsinothricin resistance N-acetyltransferase ArsN1 family B [Stellaceae bacterium]
MIEIRPAGEADGESLCRIYNHYIAETVVTFEEQPLAAAQMAARLQEIASASLPWLIAVQGAEVLGYAYASAWKGRCAYRYSTEVSVYLRADSGGRGIGSALYRELLALLKARGLHVAIGGIALPNAASVALHEKFGFEKIGQFSQVGFKFGRWIDVGYWQKVL